MSNKKLAMLAVVAAVMVVWAVVQSRVTAEKTVVQSGEINLIQGLNVNSIASIMLRRSQKKVELVNDGNGFVVAGKDGYPAQAKRVNEVIINCLDIKVKSDDLVTDNPANHAGLGVTEDKAKYVIKFLDKDAKLITGVYLSDVNPDTQGSYVRRISSDKVYFTDRSPWFRSADIDYIDRQLFGIKDEEIARVTVITPLTKYTLEVKDDGRVDFKDVYLGKRHRGQEYKKVFSALSGVQFSDVQKSSAETQDWDFDSSYRCELLDSTVYMVKLARKDGKTYVKCRAVFTDKEAIEQARRIEPDAQLAQKEAVLLARDKVKEFSARNNGWIYTIDAESAKNLSRRIYELLEPVPVAEEKEELDVESVLEELRRANENDQANKAQSEPAQAQPAQDKPSL